MRRIQQLSTTGTGDNRRYISCDEAAHECLCITLFPDCSYNQFYRNPRRDTRDYREQCRGCNNFLVVIGTILFFPIYLVFKVPYMLAYSVFTSCHCSRHSICAWFLAFWLFILGIFVDVAWIPIALFLLLAWFCLMIGKCFTACCKACDKRVEPRGHDLERDGQQPPTTVVVAVGDQPPEVQMAQ